MTTPYTRDVERQLRRGGKCAWQIAQELGCSIGLVYQVGERIGVRPKPAERGANVAAFPKFVPRPHAEIVEDLRQQLEGIESRFHQQLANDRKADRVF